MNFLDELFLSFFTILFILLITKLASASASASASNSSDRHRTSDYFKTGDSSADSEPLRSRKNDDDIRSKGDQLAAEVDGFLQVEKVDFDFAESDALIENYVSEFDEKVEVVKEDCKFGKVDIESSRTDLQSEGFREEDASITESEQEHCKTAETDAKAGSFKLQETAIEEDEDAAIEFDDKSGKRDFEIEHDTSSENVLRFSTFDIEDKFAAQETEDELNENKFACDVLDEQVKENVSEEKVNEDKIGINEFGSPTQTAKADNVEEEISVTKFDVKVSKNDDKQNEKKESEAEAVNVTEWDVNVGKTEDELNENKESKEEKSSIDESKISLLQGEDEWEGIEKSEIEKLFTVAVEFVSSEYGSNALEKVGGDVKKQLNGLHKIATEGPCYEPQSLALKVAARAKWHPWQKPGNISPDAAMEQYIAILTAKIPGWMVEKPNIEARQELHLDTPDTAGCKTDDSSKLCTQLRSSEIPDDDPPCNEAIKPNVGPSLLGKGTTSAFLLDLLCPSRVSFLTLCW